MIKLCSSMFIVVTLTLIGVATAAPTSAPLKARFVPHYWISSSPTSKIKINNIYSDSYQPAVEIYADTAIIDGMSSYATTGINIKNCEIGNVTHLNPGSAVLCKLEYGKPITFSADHARADGKPAAAGSFQITNY